MKKITAVFIGILCIFSLGVSHSAGTTLDVSVGSHAMPWLSNATLNPTFHFGVQDGMNPTVVNSSGGFSFAQGGTFTISYLSGLTSAGGGFASVDANGDPAHIFNNFLGSSGQPAPSFYMPPATYPILLMELVGTFADSSGGIVGTPFKLGDGPTSVIVPVGATRLQMGVNDDIYVDNSGSLSVRVSGPSLPPTGVPEPMTMFLLGTGLVGLVGLRRKFKR